MVFDWERHIPFVAWTIVPYWSIDLFYGVSLLLARTRTELTRHARRLLTAQALCVACFCCGRCASQGNGRRRRLGGAMFDALAASTSPTTRRRRCTSCCC
jgi:hypothetical protein